MNGSDQLIKKVGTWLTTIGFGALIGYIYVLFAYPSADGQGSPWLGVCIGIGIATVASGFELFFVSNPHSLIRKLAFIPLLLIRVLTHSLLILLVIVFCQYVYDSLYGTTTLGLDGDGLSEYIADLGFSLFVAVLIIFYLQMRLFVGARTLKNILLGKYNTPRNENRIFMFVDVVGTTAAAQKIGDIRFHKYLNRLFTLFDGPIHHYGGEIHSYVGDAIIVTWPLSSKPAKNARALLAAKRIVELCEDNADKIAQEFGERPSVRLAINGGPIVAGETGFSKRQITYLGDTINLTSRIESMAKKLDRDYLISTNLLRSIDVPNNIRVSALGAFAMKGAKEKFALSQLKFIR